MKNKVVSSLLEDLQFAEIIQGVQAACQKAEQSVKQHLINLYCNVGQYISKLTQAKRADDVIFLKVAPLVRLLI